MKWVQKSKYYIESDGYKIAKCLAGGVTYAAHAPRINEYPNLLLVSYDLEACKKACEAHKKEAKANSGTG
jgi:hypothetical protein